MSKLSLCNIYFIYNYTTSENHPFAVVELRGLWDDDDIVSLNIHDAVTMVILQEWYADRRMVCVNVTDTGHVRITRARVRIDG